MEGVGFRSVSLSGRDGERVRLFLEANGLKLEPRLDYTLVAELDGEIVATGSLAGPVLKCLATDPNYQGQGLMEKLVTRLLEEEYRRGNWHVFLYTRPANLEIFRSLGFREVARVRDRVVFFESGPENIADFVLALREKRRMAGGRVSSVVVNCNPFTRGHQYLIEKTAAESDWVHVFVVTEDLSMFPFAVRYKLVQRGTAHIPNITVHAGGQYIISQSTFPSYFTRDPNEQVEDHALLDVTIFGQYIVPALGITDRYVGQEPYCPVTSVYNRVMQQELPRYGVTVHEVPRLEVEGEAISASRVRQALRGGDCAELTKLLPSTTLDFLRSEEAQPIIHKIKESSAPH
jgi:[citrate (pro-3S)-lyase] ligase